MNHPNRRTFLESPHSHTRAQRTSSSRHSLGWSDLHQQRQDVFDVVRGVFDGIVLFSVVCVCVVVGVFAIVSVIG